MARRLFAAVLIATLLATLIPASCKVATVDIDFDRPRSGPLCVSAAVGDQLKFAWGELHNLHELPDRAGYVACDFGGAIQLAPAAPNPGGVVVNLPGEGTRFFACSKICKSNGHKVKVCVFSGALQKCDCPEGTFVGLASTPDTVPTAVPPGAKLPTAAPPAPTAAPPGAKSTDAVSGASFLRWRPAWAFAAAVYLSALPCYLP